MLAFLVQQKIVTIYKNDPIISFDKEPRNNLSPLRTTQLYHLIKNLETEVPGTNCRNGGKKLYQATIESCLKMQHFQKRKEVEILFQTSMVKNNATHLMFIAEVKKRV